METKESKIEVPAGYEIDKEHSIFRKVEEKDLPKSWEDLKFVNGFYVESNSEVCDCIDQYTVGDNKNIFPTREEAEACVALAQLCQLRDAYNEGWKPDWEDDEDKFNIFYSKNKIVKGFGHVSSSFLAFKTKEIRDKFLVNFRYLIETAKPLL